MNRLGFSSRDRRANGASIVATLSLFAVLCPRVGAQTPREFCAGGDDCIPDRLITEVSLDESAWTSDLVLDAFQPGQELSCRVAAVVRTEDIKGWSFALAHDPRRLTVLEDTVTTEGTIAHPAHPNSVAIPPHFDVTQAVDGGFISAVILSFLASTQLPVGGTHPIGRASYTIDGDPSSDGTLLELVSGEIGAPNSPPTEISFTVGTATKRPRQVLDAKVSVEFVPPPACPPWALYFEEVAEGDLDRRGEDSLRIVLRNAREALSFQFGVAVTEEEPGTFLYSFSEDLGPAEDRRIGLVITDEDTVVRRPITPNSLLADRAPVRIERGSALASFQGGDFFAVDLEPAVGTSGFTIGYLPDMEADPSRVIPPTPDDDACSTHELFVVRLDGEPVGDLARFVRGDVDGSGRVNISDAVSGLNHLFAGGEAPPCDAAVDADSSGESNLSDMIFVLEFLFRSGPAPAAPFPGCDETDEGCAVSTASCG